MKQRTLNLEECDIHRMYRNMRFEQPSVHGMFKKAMQAAKSIRRRKPENGKVWYRSIKKALLG